MSWTGEVTEDDGAGLVVLAEWTRDKPMFLGYTVFEPGDRFVETYYHGRWYSIWQVLSHRTGRTKGWYVNICRPVEVSEQRIDFIDMELDLFVFPDGRYVVLDEDDLERKVKSAQDRALARAGLAQVLELVNGRQAPFQDIGPPRRIEPFWDPAEAR